MTRIRILPEILANKIAAGEVVERPASVVKELVENSLDADSSRIAIDIEQGGRALIRVADNGSGMGHDDALLALERFATSKIRGDGDLFSIQTLGFRGEALPSIAAVSKMTLVTRDRESDSGVEVRINGGKILEVLETGAPTGTMVSVARLFYNTPARRKFLKTVNTEMAHIGDVVAGMALGRHQVHFKLTHNAKVVKQWPKAADPAQRVAAVLGQVDANELIPLSAQADDLKIEGYLGSSRLARRTSRGIYLYVNGRRVRDRVVQHALFEGFSGRLVKGQFPLAVVFLELPFDRVDVNVHPAKHEIRFADQRRVHNAVRDRVARALEEAERRLWAVEPDAPASKEDSPVSHDEAPYRIVPPKQKEADRVSEEAFIYVRQTPSASESAPLPVDGDDAGGGAISFTSGPVQPAETHSPKDQKPLWQTGGFSDLEVIGQLHGTYVICQGPMGLIVIDQHAAHERIVYEQLRARSGCVESQRLLMPETVELGFDEARTLEVLIPHLNDFGLEVEPFGGSTFAVKAIPAILDDRDISGVITELVDLAAGMDLESGLEKVLDQCRMVMACHNAVRANQRLTREQIQDMLARLDQCRDPSHCPHGRPTWIQWTIKELEKQFKRIVP